MPYFNYCGTVWGNIGVLKISTGFIYKQTNLMYKAVSHLARAHGQEREKIDGACP